MKAVNCLPLYLPLTLAAAMLFGCPPAQTTTTQAPATTQPATSATQPVLDAKALLSLAKLTPEVGRPVNPPAASSRPMGVNVDNLLSQAQQKIASKEYTSALESLQRAVGFEPENPQVHKAMAACYVGLASYGKAFESLSKSTTLAPDDLESQLLLAKLQTMRGQSDQAILALRKATKTTAAKPQNPLAAEVMAKLGEALQKSGYLTASLEAFTKLGEWIDAHGDEYLANATLQPLLLQPERLQIQRGSLMLQLGQPKAAVEVLSKAYSSDRANIVASRLLVEALAQDKQYDRAQTILLEMASQPSQESQVASLAQSLAMISGRKDLPINVWQAYIDSGKKETTLALAMANVAYTLGAPDQAKKILLSALEKQPGSTVTNKALAELNVKIGQYSEAVDILALILAADSDQLMDIAKTLRQIAKLAPDFAAQFSPRLQDDKSAQAPAMHYLCGQLYAFGSNQSAAASQYKYAIQKQTDFLPAYDALLNLYIDQRQSSDAQNLLTDVQKLSEVEYGYYKAYLRGKHKLFGGNVEGAIKELASARESRKGFLPATILLARAQVSSGKQEEAAQLLITALRENPDNEDVNRMLVNMLVSRSRIGDAQEVVKQFIERRPDSLVGKILQAELHLLSKQPEQARALLEEVRKVAPDQPDLQLLDFSLTYGQRLGSLKDDQWQEPVARIKAILSSDPNNESALRILGAIMDHPSRREHAPAIWKALYEDTGKPLHIARIYAMVLVQARQFQQAADVLSAVLEGNPRDTRLRMTMLEALEKSDRSAEAAKLAQQYLRDAQDDSDRTIYRRILLKFYGDSKQYDKAQALLDDWILLCAEQQLGNQLRGQKLRLYGQAKQYDQAISFGQKWIDEQRRQSAELGSLPQLLLLETLEEGKQYSQALALLDGWLKKSPDDQALLMRQVMLLGDAGQIDQACTVGLAWIARKPEQTIAREALVMTLSKAGQDAKAITLMEGWLASSQAAGSSTTSPATQAASGPAVALDQDTTDWCRVRIVSLLVAMQKYPEAIAKIDTYSPFYADKKPLPQLPNVFGPQERQRRVENPYITLQSSKSTCLTEMGKPKEGLELLEKIYQQFPDDPWLNNNLGYMYTDRGIKLDKAEAMLRKALTDIGDSIAIQDSLGWVFYKQGKVAEAARVFGMILADERSKIDNGVIHDHAADAFYRLGEKDKARELWTKALDLAVNEKVADNEVRRLRVAVKAKLEALKSKQEPVLAPLGEGVKLP